MATRGRPGGLAQSVTGGVPAVRAYVLSANLHRRHLNESQRAMVAAKLATLGHGQRAERSANLPISPDTQPEAAAMLHVSTRAGPPAVHPRMRGEHPTSKLHPDT
jgi:hypothetical protein